MANLVGVALFLAVAVGFYSCNKYSSFSSDDTKVRLEQEKTKQLEIQVKLKNCKE